MHLSVPNHVTQLRPTQLLEVEKKIISEASFAIGISAFVLLVPPAQGLCESKLGLTDTSVVLSDHTGPLRFLLLKPSFTWLVERGLDHVQSLVLQRFSALCEASCLTGQYRDCDIILAD